MTEVDTAVRLARVSTSSGGITVVAEQRLDVDVDGKAIITRAGSVVTVQGGSGRLTVRVPADTDVSIGSQSGKIEVTGRAGAVSAVAESGHVQIEHARSVDIRATSGHVEVGNVVGTCCVRNVSGRIEVGGTADVDAATTSGHIELRAVRGMVRAHCISGRIEIEMIEAHDVDAETVSGRITVRLPAATVVGVDCTVHTRSVSGRVDVAVR